MLQDIEFTSDIYFRYNDYSEPLITHKRLRHDLVLQLINDLNKNIFTVTKEGSSIEGREIFSITAGTGKKKILCWSQMHGDESTATMALFDVMRFLSADDHLNHFRSNLLKHLQITMVPMLNPDGAERFTRRNKAGVDLNRDALRLVSPESALLDNLVRSIKPDFSFNLHDQDTHYTAGKSFKSAAISFLAPPFDDKNTLDNVRLNAVKLISKLYKILTTVIPGHIGKYKDEFEPRAFGDNIQKSGSSVILVESGGWKDDNEKQFIRKLNFIILLSAFKSISEESFRKEDAEVYNSIPFNEEYLFDVLLRNLNYKVNGRDICIDIGIMLIEQTSAAGTGYYTGRIADMGDLSIFYGNVELNLSGFDVTPGKTAKTGYDSAEDLNENEIISLLQQGITNIIVDKSHSSEFSDIPLNVIFGGSYEKEEISVDDYANLVISKDGIVKYLVVNGSLIQPHNPYENFSNALLL